MLGLRYEDYTGLDEGLPFVFSPAIERDPSNISREANWHENTEIQICTEGEGYILLDGKRYPFSKGDIAVMNSNVIHYTCSENKITYTCLIIDSDFCLDADVDHLSLRFEELFRCQKMLSLFKSLEKTYFDTEDSCRIARLRMNVLNILIELKEKHTVSVAGVTSGRNGFEEIKSAIRYIRENYDKRLTLDVIAKSVFIDKYTLSRNFKSATGQTVVEYINAFRCRRAASMISSGMTVSEAATSCGFGNMSFFSKTFKKYMGILPHDAKSTRYTKKKSR